MFDLSGKVAIVTGCNTGLGQGMALALAQAGCDIVGVNIVPPSETATAVAQMGRRFHHIAADLGCRGRGGGGRAQQRRRSDASTSW